jgi:hypothetical protein
MAIALILQRFQVLHIRLYAVVAFAYYSQVELAEPNYELKIRQTLTIKPMGYHLKVRLRPGKSLYTGIVSSETHASEPAKDKPPASQASSDDLPQLTVLYGSNQGTCKTCVNLLSALQLTDLCMLDLRSRSRAPALPMVGALL